MGQFAIHKLFDNTKDIQRTYMFDMNIPDMSKYGIGDDELVIRCRTAVLPQRSNEPIESSFMGMKRMFPGKPVFTHTLALTFEEFEDRKVSTALYNWQQDIFDIETNGAALVKGKSDITRTATLQLYGFDGEPINGGKNSKIEFHNAWIQDVAEVALDYTASDSVKYAIMLQYDRFEMR